MGLDNGQILNALKNKDKDEKREIIRSLTYEKIKELYQLDNDFFNYVVSIDSCNGFYYLVSGFSTEDIYDFFNYFYNNINLLDDDMFYQLFSRASYLCGDNTCQKIGGFVYADVKIQREETIKFLNFIFNKYENRLKNIESYSMLLYILTNVADKGTDKSLLEKFIFNNEEKFKSAFKQCDHNRLFDLFEGFNSENQIFLLTYFYDEICNHVGFKGLCNCLHDDVLVYVYERDNKIINKIPIRQFLRCTLTDKTKNILDKYEIEDMGDAFSSSSWAPVENIKYIEKVLMDKIVCDGNLSKIDEETSLFSKAYCKNLKEIRLLIENKIITRNSEIYINHFKVFYKYLVSSKNLGELNENEVKEIEKLFFRTLKKDGFWSIKKLNTINMITLFNRIGIVDDSANQFSVEQILKYSVKEHKRLCEIVKSTNDNARNYKIYVLKLMMIVGYKRAEYILKIDSDIETLHHLVGNISVKNIKMDKEGNPVVDNKFINLLFKDKDHNRVRLMLENKDSELYKYFPRIINEWELIKISNKNKSLKEVIEFLKNGSVVVPDKYYRLDGLFKLIGRNSELVLETFRLHDEMLKRIETTIPRVKGNVNGYEYEVLRYDDMEGLVVGNMTDCCFTVKGVSRTSLSHALTSKNGRILTVKKDGELLAHSWLWRNGNVLCLDNIEISKKIKTVDFLEVYEEFASAIVEESSKCEGEECISNVLIGGDAAGTKYRGIVKYHKVVYPNNLVAPIEEGLYSDAKYCQWLIKGKGDFSFYQSDCCYRDERKDVLEYDAIKKNDWDLIKILNKKVNALKSTNEDEKEQVKIDVRTLSKVYCSEDFYILIDKKGNIEKYIQSNDSRAYQEMENILNSLNKKII